MRFVYFDECKYLLPAQPNYWLGAISVKDTDLTALEDSISDVALEFFGNKRLSRATEFHAKDIFHRKHQFADWQIETRLACLERLASIAGGDLVRRIYVRIFPDRMLASKGWDSHAFMHLVERVQIDCIHLNDNAILIGDLDGEFADGSVANLSRFREGGTDFQYGRTIDRLVDSVYFIPSHHSRLIQLADVYTYCLHTYHGPGEDNYTRRRLKGHIRERTHLLSPNRYKEWPSA